MSEAEASVKLRPRAAVKSTIRKATGHDLRDEFTSFVEAATTILTGIHAELRSTQRAVNARADATEAAFKAAHDAAEQQATQHKEATNEQLRIQDERQQRQIQRVDHLMLAVQQEIEKGRAGRDATFGALHETSALHQDLNHQGARLGQQVAWLWGLAGVGLALSTTALVMAWT